MVAEPAKPKTYLPLVPAIARPVAAKKPQPEPIAAEVALISVAPDPLPVAALPVPTIVKPREAVQTGLFGQGAESGTSHRAGTDRADVVNAGFSEGSTNGGGRGTGGRGGVLRAGFGGDGTRSGARSEKPAPQTLVTNPVKILSKPVPKFTSEAIAKNVEGDVLLSVVFEATGQVRVVRVVQGLGYGLDEAAELAAKQIQFRPAQQDGKPVDFVANIRIAFQRAS